MTFSLPDGFERNDLFLGEMSHFLAVARGAVQPACTLDDGIAVLQLALAIHQSALSGQRMQL
jgi:predicted dehydrogenase